MKKFYQAEWQGIRFSDFTVLSSTNLAGPAFYQSFYDEFFKRYQGWEQLSSSWRKEKERCAEFILARSGTSSKVLSVGCGLGTMEHYIHAQQPELDLLIHEVAPSAWRWVENDFAKERKLLGLIPACLPSGMQFDLVYLCAVDYALSDDVLVDLLRAMRPVIKAGGQCLLISASFQDTPATLRARISSLVQESKAFAAAALDVCGLRSRGQFWGWMRSQKEYQTLMRRAGYRDIDEGFVDPGKRAHYWISGR